jgi:hypothetical protein
MTARSNDGQNCKRSKSHQRKLRGVSKARSGWSGCPWQFLPNAPARAPDGPRPGGKASTPQHWIRLSSESNSSASVNTLTARRHASFGGFSISAAAIRCRGAIGAAAANDRGVYQQHLRGRPDPDQPRLTDFCSDFRRRDNVLAVTPHAEPSVRGSRSSHTRHRSKSSDELIIGAVDRTGRSN